MKGKGRKHSAVVWSALLLLSLLICSQAGAQVTASIGGTVSDVSGPLPGATVSAKNTQSAFVYKTTADNDGSFLLGGLPPGTYEITVSSEAYKPQTQTVTVLLGQANKLNFQLKLDMVVVADATVVGETTKVLIDTRSSAITTNITPQQMDNLPLNNRNFLAFAALAPGVRFTDNTDAVGQEFGSGGANPKQVNVFIDGLSYKNDIIKGGAFMQDSSRGNPFPQSAVQEYQVLTQNYKAEYEKAAAAVITAVTKSGGNAFHGDALFLYQNKSMIELDQFAKDRGDEKPPYTRKQYSLSLGGPVVKDQLNFFVSVEQNNRDVIASVFRGSSYDQAPANVKAILDPYQTGSLSSPFTEKLYFGKLSWQPNVSQTMDLSYNKRDEQDIRGFGTQRVKEGAENFKVPSDAAVLRHQLIAGNNMLNEASLNYQTQEWINTAIDASKPHQNYVGLLDIGGKDYIQDLLQKRTGIRDDLTYFGEWHGTHTVKGGVTANWMKYDMSKAAFGNPYFEYRRGDAPNLENWQFPFKAVYGFGNPSLNFSNTQYGIYIQDDWMPTKNFTVNVGLRWDYETNMLNNGWRTPADVVSGLETACKTYSQPVGGKTTWCIPDIFNPSDFISNGNRSSYKGMLQPRLGFSWAPSANGRTVVFGGWGLYYDRVTLNDIYDEQYRHSWKQYTFCFTGDPANVGKNTGCGVNNLLWNPSYLSAAGLAGLIASGQTPGPEIFLLNNTTKPPRSIQWNLGVRQQLGSWLAAFTYANSRGYNSLVWSFGTDPPGTAFNDRWGNWIQIPGYGFIMRSYDVRRTWYDGYFLTFDKPYTVDSKWGFTFAYTYADAFGMASNDEGAAFAFDFLPPDLPRFPSNFSEKHRVVMSGTVGLPAGFRASSIITLGSGVPYSSADASQGWDKFVYRYNVVYPQKFSFLGIKEWAYRSVDLRVEWDANLGGDLRFGLIGEAFNVFNWANYTYSEGWGSSGFQPPPGEINANFGKPTGAYNARRFQIGARFSF